MLEVDTKQSNLLPVAHNSCHSEVSKYLTTEKCVDENVNILQRQEWYFPSLDHDQKVVIWVKVAELVVALESDPHVRTQVKFPVVLEVNREGDIVQKLRKSLLHRGHCKIAGPGSGVSLQ